MYVVGRRRKLDADWVDEEIAALRDAVGADRNGRRSRPKFGMRRSRRSFRLPGLALGRGAAMPWGMLGFYSAVVALASLTGWVVVVALALVLAGAALLPPRMLVGPASRLVEPRRDLLFIGGIAVAILVEIVYVVGGS
jgi:hypothetical protein